jgi:hypothetical protein
MLFFALTSDALAMHGGHAKARLTLSISFHRQIPIYVDCGVRYLE